MALDDEILRKKIRTLPDSPGVYQYFGSNGNIIYIGKAKNLKKRVTSYLNKNQTSKTKVLVSKVVDLKYIVVDSEQDALLLENNLIKEYQPRYNILLKDDKTYPWIIIKKERFPRVETTRKLNIRTAEYFGPFTSVKFANTLIGLIKSLFKLRTCNLPLDQKSISSGKFTACLDYGINKCPAPCIGLCSENEYNENISQIRNILKGNFSEVISYLQTKEHEYADSMQYEKAYEVKTALENIRDYKSKSTIVRTSISNTDVFGYVKGDKYCYVNYLGISDGAVNRIHTIELEPKIDEDDESILSMAIYEIRKFVGSVSKEIIIPFHPDIELDGILYTLPIVGDKKKLLDLSVKNAKQYKLDKERMRMRRDKSISSAVQELMLKMKNDLKLSTFPYRIECFDNSNIQGTNPVAACTVFINGKPAKSEYRKFHIKTVEGPDDYASMTEVVTRRYSRQIQEGGPLPDLIVIDGGKGQLGAALKALESLGLRGKIDIVALAEKLEEVYYPGDAEPWILSKRSEALNILMRIRDEAHRFGITFHRSLRLKTQSVSELDEIDGIGPKTRTLLLRTFGSVENIKKTNLDTLAAAIGNSKARLIRNHFDK